MYDLIIKNGIVIDPSQKLNENSDIFIKDGVFVSPDPNDSLESIKVIDARGCYVTPGLIDSHIHLFESGSELGGKADLVCPPNCVTTAIDAGSAGLYNFDAFYQNDIMHSTTSIKATLHPSNTGVHLPPHEEIQDPDSCEPKKIRKIFQKYRDTLVGLKIRVHDTVTSSYGLKALAKAAEVSKTLKSEGFQCNVMVHFGNLAEGIQVEDVLNLLSENDVLTHIFRTNGTTILDGDGKVLSCVREARERGVVFESGCARFHLSLDVAKKCIQDGFYPQIISTDMIEKAFYWKPAHSLMFKMTLYSNLGMNVNDLITATTYKPASVYGLLDEAGTLQIGKRADVAIFKVVEKKFRAEDVFGNSLDCTKMFVPMATIKAGIPVFQQIFM